MKKFCVFCVAAMLVMAACDNPVDLGGSNDAPVQYTADGRPMVQISLGTSSSSRALTDSLAKAGFDLYEAVFKDPAAAGVYYRKSWFKGESAKIYLPTGDYGTSAKAILLIGASSDKTLLAVGTITGIDDGSGSTASTVVTSSTKAITFTTYSIETDISKTYSATTSTFAILTPTSHATTAGTLPTVDGYPYFSVPYSTTGATAVTANYTFYCTTGGSFADYVSGLFVKGIGTTTTPAATLTSAGLAATNGDYVPIAVTPGSPAFTSLTVDAAIPAATLPISFSVPQSLKPGMSKIYIDIPVYGLDKSVNGITWHLKGGLANSMLDGGKAANLAGGAGNGATGGAILIGIGNVDGITLTPSYP